MKISNLPKDLVEDVLSRVPVKSIRKVRFTCKKWNTLSKGKFFAKKHLDHERLATADKCMVVVMMDFSVYLMNINLHDNVMEREAKLISLVDSCEVDIAKVFHCNGLLLCITKDHSKLVVWNPYWGQTQCIEPTLNSKRLDHHSYAIGYDDRCSYKILRFFDRKFPTPFVEVKIYDLNSDSWRALDVVPDGQIHHYDHGVSLKGNTYWFAREKPSETKQGDEDAFLVCFDFTSERFGPLLTVPFEWFSCNDASLSNVRDEQLAILSMRYDTFMLEIWITTKIEPNAVSWSSKVFLAIDMIPLIDLGFRPDVSFFIDEEKQVAVVFGKDTREGNCDINPTRNVVYIFGVDGSYTKLNLGDSTDKKCYPLGCSYVPSLVQQCI